MSHPQGCAIIRDPSKARSEEIRQLLALMKQAAAGHQHSHGVAPRRGWGRRQGGEGYFQLQAPGTLGLDAHPTRFCPTASPRGSSSLWGSRCALQPAQAPTGPSAPPGPHGAAPRSPAPGTPRCGDRASSQPMGSAQPGRILPAQIQVLCPVHAANIPWGWQPGAQLSPGARQGPCQARHAVSHAGHGPGTAALGTEGPLLGPHKGAVWAGPGPPGHPTAWGAGLRDRRCARAACREAAP